MNKARIHVRVLRMMRAFGQLTLMNLSIVAFELVPDGYCLQSARASLSIRLPYAWSLIAYKNDSDGWKELRAEHARESSRM